MLEGPYTPPPILLASKLFTFIILFLDVPFVARQSIPSVPSPFTFRGSFTITELDVLNAEPAVNVRSAGMAAVNEFAVRLPVVIEPVVVIVIVVKDDPPAPIVTGSKLLTPSIFCLVLALDKQFRAIAPFPLTYKISFTITLFTPLADVPAYNVKSDPQADVIKGVVIDVAFKLLTLAIFLLIAPEVPPQSIAVVESPDTINLS